MPVAACPRRCGCQAEGWRMLSSSLCSLLPGLGAEPSACTWGPPSAHPAPGPTASLWLCPLCLTFRQLPARALGRAPWAALGSRGRQVGWGRGWGRGARQLETCLGRAQQQRGAVPGLAGSSRAGRAPQPARARRDRPGHPRPCSTRGAEG